MAGAYFDNNATTPLDPRVRDAMLPWMGARWGNASSAHSYGRAAHEAVEAARDQVAALLDVSAGEVVFTASGTEANNAVVRTALEDASAGAPVPRHALVSALEHPSILNAFDGWAAAAGVEVTRVAPRRDGVVTPEAFGAALRPASRFAALQLVNNELGTIQPVAEVAALLRERGVPLLCDAVQAAGKIEVRAAELGADYLTLGAHKFGGPLGAAALWIRRGARFAPLLLGGAQERRQRASTVNVPAIVGFGTACELARIELADRARKLSALRERFETGLALIPDTLVHGAGAPRAPHTTNVAFAGVLNAELMMRLDLAGYAISTGPACGSGTVEPTPALAALGLPREEAISSLRVSFGTQNRLDEVDDFLAVLTAEVARLRAMSAPTPAVAAGA